MRFHRYSCKKYRINVHSWSIRTLFGCKDSGKYECCTDTIVKPQLSGKDHLTESGIGYSFFWKSNPKGKKHEQGVGFAIHTELTKYLEHLKVLVTVSYSLEYHYLVTVI